MVLGAKKSAAAQRKEAAKAATRGHVAAVGKEAPKDGVCATEEQERRPDEVAAARAAAVDKEAKSGGLGAASAEVSVRWVVVVEEVGKHKVLMS